MSMVNKVRALGARATMRDEDIRSRLEDDHNRMKEILAQMCEARPASRRRALFAEIEPLVTAHARAEERTAYDALLKARAGQPPHTLAQEGYVEHSMVDDLLARMKRVGAETDVWLAHARVLRELLTTHIAEEQSETFAELGEHFSRDELADLGARFDRDKQAMLRGTAPRQRKTGARIALERRGHGAPRRKPPKKATERSSATAARTRRQPARVASRGASSPARRSARTRSG